MYLKFNYCYTNTTIPIIPSCKCTYYEITIKNGILFIKLQHILYLIFIEYYIIVGTYKILLYFLIIVIYKSDHYA